MATDNEKRVEMLLKIAGVTKFGELAKIFKTNQPQISRWKINGFHGCTNEVIDFLLSVISKQKREINELKKEIKSLKKGG